MVDPVKPTRWKNFLSYGSGDYALNLFWQGTGFFLFYFYTSVLGVSSTAAGTIILIGSLWDGLSDPIMGLIADRTKSRWGPDKPYIFLGALPLGLSFVLLFTPVDIDGSLTDLAYLLGVLLLFRTCYTVVSIPYSTLGARTTRNSTARTKLAGIRMYFGFLGGVSISLTAKFLQNHLNGTQSFYIMAIVAATVGITVLILCFSFTQESQNPINKKHETVGIIPSLVSTFANRALLLLICAIIFVSIATTTINQTTLLFFEARFGTTEIGNNGVLIITIVPLFFIPLWMFIALSIGKKRAWLIGSATAAFGLFMMSIDTSATPLFTYIALIIITVGLSAYGVLFWSMLPDTIEYGARGGIVQTESFLFGLASSFQKISTGFSAFVLGLSLDAVGFKAGTMSTDTVIEDISDIYTLIPIGALLASAAVIYFYPITAKIHGDIVTSLEKNSLR